MSSGVLTQSYQKIHGHINRIMTVDASIMFILAAGTIAAILIPQQEAWQRTYKWPFDQTR